MYEKYAKHNCKCHVLFQKYYSSANGNMLAYISVTEKKKSSHLLSKV